MLAAIVLESWLKSILSRSDPGCGKRPLPNAEPYRPQAFCACASIDPYPSENSTSA